MRLFYHAVQKKPTWLAVDATQSQSFSRAKKTADFIFNRP